MECAVGEHALSLAAAAHDGQTPTGKYKVPGWTPLLRVVELYVKEGRGAEREQ